MFEMSFYFAACATSVVVVIVSLLCLVYALFSLAEYRSKEDIGLIFLILVILFVAFFSIEYFAQLISTIK